MQRSTGASIEERYTDGGTACCITIEPDTHTAEAHKGSAVVVVVVVVVDVAEFMTMRSSLSSRNVFLPSVTPRPAPNESDSRSCWTHLERPTGCAP
jgi:hypothetical protein